MDFLSLSTSLDTFATISSHHPSFLTLERATSVWCRDLCMSLHILRVISQLMMHSTRVTTRWWCWAVLFFRSASFNPTWEVRLKKKKKVARSWKTIVSEALSLTDLIYPTSVPPAIALRVENGTHKGEGHHHHHPPNNSRQALKGPRW